MCIKNIKGALCFLFLLLQVEIMSAKTSTRQPWTFWYWMYGAVSDEGIRADLKAMADVGIGGFYLMPIKDSKLAPQYNGDSDQLTPNWWKRIDTVYKVADSLHLDMGIHFCDGFALGGGPWITEEESMQKVVFRDTLYSGKSAEIEKIQSLPNTIGVYAYPAKYADDQQPEASVEFPFSSKTPCEIVMSYKQPFVLRSVKIITGGNNIQAHRWNVYASDDGKEYHFVRNIEPARRGWQDTDEYATYAIPPTKGRYFKFCWSPEGSDPGSEDLDAAKWKPNLKLGRLILSSEPVVDNYEAKSGAVWRVAQENAFGTYYPQSEIFQINPSTIKKLKKGKWHILWIGHASTKHENATGGGGKGLECDKFSRNAIRKQFDNWFSDIYDRAPKDVARRVLTRLHVDSWECGSQNWSDIFPDEFQKRRGYSIMPWLPLFAGVPMVSAEKTETVLRDVRLTIAELINDIFFDEVSKLAKQYNVELSCECVAPTMVSDGMLHYQHADYPMGEFWLNSPTHDKPNDMLDAVSGAHIYGKNIIQAESFTNVRATWDETPATLKPLLDRNFCLGINSIVYHVNTHNPWLDRQPGMTLDGIGTFFQRDNTWWSEMKAFNSYVSRCQEILQTGKPVVDIAVYTGDEIPRRALLPERIVGSLPGLFGNKLIEQENARLANLGIPMEVSPVGVTHTANMTKADMFTNPLHGYKYDSFNHDVLRDARVENGELVTRGGMHYKVLVVPQPHKLNPDNINSIREDLDRLSRQGLKIIETPWTESDLSTLGIERDIVLPEGLDYCHRQTDNEDYYFISNLTDSAITFSPQFRSHRQYCYTYNPMDSIISEYSDNVTLHSHHSIFFILTNESRNENENPQPSTLTSHPSPWTISFEKTGKVITTDTLFDWTAKPDRQIKYYSGRATYDTEFTLDSSCAILSLGKVYNIATVYVNDICCGTAWLAPYEIDISKAIRKGENHLRIEVVNTWANALLGNDNGNPPFEGIWTNGKYRRAEKKLLPSGLVGPVTIKTF